MDAKTLDHVCDQVYRKYPEVKGVRPKLQPLSKGTTSQHVLIFSSHATSTSGQTIPRVVRVVVNGEGKIVKMSTSK
jgi:hypothetical protein